MIQDVFSALIAFFVIDPLQSDLAATMEQMNRPIAVVEQAQACLAAQGPKLVKRAANDWVWAGTTIVSLASGLSEPHSLLDRANPACSALIEALNASEISDV